MSVLRMVRCVETPIIHDFRTAWAFFFRRRRPPLQGWWSSFFLLVEPQGLPFFFADPLDDTTSGNLRQVSVVVKTIPFVVYYWHELL